MPVGITWHFRFPVRAKALEVVEFATLATVMLTVSRGMSLCDVAAKAIGTLNQKTIPQEVADGRVPNIYR